MKMSAYAIIIVCFLIVGVYSASEELSLDIAPYDIVSGTTTVKFCGEKEFGRDKTALIYIEAKGRCEVASILCHFEPDASEPCGASTLRVSIKSFNFEENGFSIQKKAIFELHSPKFFLGLQTTEKSRGGTFSCEATCEVTKEEKEELTEPDNPLKKMMHEIKGIFGD